MKGHALTSVPPEQYDSIMNVASVETKGVIEYRRQSKSVFKISIMIKHESEVNGKHFESR